MQTETALGTTTPAVAPTDGAGRATGDLSVNGRILDRLLGMAHRYRSEGNLRQAMELYWNVLENHPGTAQAESACVCLLDQADAYERDGAGHVARAVYERLL